MGEVKQEETKAETQSEEKKEEKPAEEKKEEATPPPSPIVLFVDMHCVGCAKKIEKCIMKFKGVEGVQIDLSQNQVTVKGVLDPQALSMRIQNKTRRKARVLSPLPKDGESGKPEIVTSQVSGLTTVELNVNMHCEACAQQLRSKILKMRGVQSAETQLSTGKVTVTGAMDANRLVDYVYRRTRKLPRIVPQLKEQKEEEQKKGEGEKEGEKPPEEAPEENAEKKEEESAKEKKEEEKAPEQGGEKRQEKDKKEEKGAEEGEEAKKELGEEVTSNIEETANNTMYNWQPMYVIELVPPPQLFSDENPNACCIS